LSLPPRLRAPYRRASDRALNTPLPEGMIEAPIGRSGLDRTKMTVTPLLSKEARTEYQVLERFTIATYLKVALITGRTHQIRVHHRGRPFRHQSGRESG